MIIKMKTELAKRLLSRIIGPIYENDEDEAEKIFYELQFLAEYKYDHYEMYGPGRHFLEHLYIWIKQFEKEDRKVALNFVRNNLIFFSRNEFELLARVLYWDIVRNIQLDIAAQEAGLPRYKVKKIRDSDELKRIQRSSLYIAMSDGARIDYFRRRASIGNEQVLLSYHVDQYKCNEMLKKLCDTCGEGAKFRLVFLIDDFCASGSTLIREKDGKLNGTLRQLETKTFPYLSEENGQKQILNPSLPEYLLSDDCKIYLCTLLSTQKAVDHIRSHICKLSSQLNKIEVLPVSILDDALCFRDKTSDIGKICSKYYQERMGDEHTGNVTFGYKECGLPVVLHHNTPNNSLYLLWNRLAIEPQNGLHSFEPLFKRIERHKSSRE